MDKVLVLVGVLAAALPGCKRERAEPGGQPGAATAPKPVDPKVAVAEAGKAACAKAKPHGAVAWIEDDWSAAVACARSRNVPIVLDLWAPWCHTCLSMQTTVFADDALKPRADQFVFASLDTDRDANAPAVARYPLSAWPTFYVVGPDQAVLGRFVGAASLAQFQAFLDTGLRAAKGAAGAEQYLLAAERLIATKELAAAEQQLLAALAAAPAEWPRRPDALVSLIGTRRKLGDHAGCLALAEKSLDETGNAASASDFLALAMDCAEARAKDEAPRVKALRERAVARWQKLLDDKTAPLTVDDRSDAMAQLRTTLDALGKPAEAKALAERQRALLDEATAKAPTPLAAMTHIWPRSEVYVYLGKPLDLVPSLEELAAKLPDEYDPPARIGWLYLKAGKLAEAATWTDRALAKVYGPRKVRVLTQRAEIAAKQNDRPGERKAREAIVATLEALPKSQTTPEQVAKAKEDLAKLAP